MFVLRLDLGFFLVGLIMLFRFVFRLLSVFLLMFVVVCCCVIVEDFDYFFVVMVNLLFKIILLMLVRSVWYIK